MSVITERRKAWVAALRSGRFEQGQVDLQRGNNYCCLGVGCIVAIEDGLILNRVEWNGCVIFDSHPFTMPANAKDYYNLSDKTQQVLIGMNDRLCNSFAQIADYLEEEWGLVGF